MAFDLRAALGLALSNEPAKMPLEGGSFVLLRRTEFQRDGNQPYQDALKGWFTVRVKTLRNGASVPPAEAEAKEKELIARHLFAGGTLIVDGKETPFTPELFKEALCTVPEFYMEVRNFVGGRENFAIARTEPDGDAEGK